MYCSEYINGTISFLCILLRIYKGTISFLCTSQNISKGRFHSSVLLMQNTSSGRFIPISHCLMKPKLNNHSCWFCYVPFFVSSVLCSPDLLRLKSDFMHLKTKQKRNISICEFSLVYLECFRCSYIKDATAS